MDRSIIDMEEGWDYLKRGITKLINILEGLPEPQFNTTDYLMLYTVTYTMSTEKPPFDYEWELYERYRETFEEYIKSTVLPSLREKHEEIMLSEFVKRWSNHCTMVRWLSRFFSYLDQRFIKIKSLPSLEEVGNTCFTSLVYQEFNTKVKDVVISLIAKERDGEQIDRDLLKNVVNVFIGIGNGAMDYYEDDFEEAMLEDSATYYSQKASNWILKDDYMSKENIPFLANLQ